MIAKLLLEATTTYAFLRSKPKSNSFALFMASPFLSLCFSPALAFIPPFFIVEFHNFWRKIQDGGVAEFASLSALVNNNFSLGYNNVP
jgi:hypothetical protein